MAEQELIICEAQLEDAKSLSEVLKLVQEETDFLTRDSDSPAMSAEQAEIFIDSQLQKENAICFVAKLGSQVVGVLNVSAGTFAKTNHIGEVFIAVKKTYQSYGIGSFLMEALIDWAEHTSAIRRLELEVQVRNDKAVGLYQKFGFVIEGTKQRGAKTKNGEFLDVYAMAKLID
ncbi:MULTISPECIES: GNAT family N-acetyltransferase [Streptococcus]|uniref:GNAT family N-acetyltransferase n=1 Tax=Streptococcus caledonicus TaxID=2614158 RepID=A0ABW0UEV7_9STRE|nr:GNAT family N-acetyltransferase [Streptococcus sp. S784/96/1]